MRYNLIYCNLMQQSIAKMVLFVLLLLYCYLNGVRGLISINKDRKLLQSTRVYNTIFESLKERIMGKPKEYQSYVPDEKNDESDYLIEYLNYKPWRAPKVKYLKKHYKPWSSSWQEKYRSPDDETIYSYTVRGFRTELGTTKIYGLYNSPWLWSSNKVERITWLYKLLYNDLDNISVQEMIELDALFSEYQFALRWGHLRLKELESLNVLGLFMFTCFDLVWFDPTDRGIRPDHTLRTCPIQFHNCISSSNEPTDIEHYAPPLRYSRSKSPQQVFDEIKEVWKKYPKRGLRWSSGWIDRGGWKPRQFNGNYFYAQSDSYEFQFRDDTELLIDTKKREVQYRSSARLGQFDFDTQRLRYNQFVRMLTKKGGWEVQQMPRYQYIISTPVRWTRFLLDKGAMDVEQTTNNLLVKLQSTLAEDETQPELISTDKNNDNDNDQAAQEFIQSLLDKYFIPLEEQITNQVDQVIESNPVLQTIRSELIETKETIEDLSNRAKEEINQLFHLNNNEVINPDKVDDENNDDFTDNNSEEFVNKESYIAPIEENIVGIRQQFKKFLYEKISSIQQPSETDSQEFMEKISVESLDKDNNPDSIFKAPKRSLSRGKQFDRKEFRNLIQKIRDAQTLDSESDQADVDIIKSVDAVSLTTSFVSEYKGKIASTDYKSLVP